MAKVIKKIAAVGVTGALVAFTGVGALAADLTTFKETFTGSGTAIVIGDGASAADGGARDTIYEYFGGTAGEEDTTTGVSAKQVDKQEIDLGDNLAVSGGLESIYQDEDGFDVFQDAEVSIGGSNYDFHDELMLSTTTGDLIIQTALSSADDKYEDNVGLELKKDGLKYCWVFDETINISKQVTSSNTWDLEFMGESFRVTSVADNDTLTMEVGDRYTLNPGETVTVSGVAIEVVSSDSSSVVLNVGTDEGRTINEGSSISYQGLEIYLSSAIDATNSEDKVVVLIIGDDAVKTYNDQDEFKDYCSPEGGFGDDDCKQTNPDWIWDIKGLVESASGNTNSLCIENDFTKDDWDDGVPSVGEAYALPNNFASVGIDSLTVSDDNYITVKIEYESSADLGGNLTSAPAIHVEASGGDDLLELVANQFNGTNLTAGQTVGTNEFWLYHDTTMDNNANGNRTRVFYKNSNGNTVIVGDLIAENSGEAVIGWARIDFKKTTGNDARFSLTGNGSTANAQWLGLVPDTTLVSGDQLWVRLGSYASYGAFNGFGASASAEEKGELVYGVAANPESATSTSQYGTNDEPLRMKYGIVVSQPDTSLNNDEVKLTVPGDQVQAWAAAWQGAFKGTATGSGTSTDVPELLEVADVTEASAQNLILVGGPCVNDLTAEFLGLAAGTCGEASGLAPDEAVVSMLANGDKWAALVYGWEAADTARAANAVADETLNAAVGDVSATV